MANPNGSTNHREAQKCIVNGCNCNQNGNGLGLCAAHYEDVLWMRHEGYISDPPYTDEARDVVVGMLDAFSAPCAQVFDAGGRYLYAAPVRLARPGENGNGRIR